MCLLSLALVLPQYSKNYIKAKIGDTITQAKCKCRLNHQPLHIQQKRNVAKLVLATSDTMQCVSLHVSAMEVQRPALKRCA